eukprot:2566722-Rhodomonas_salina.2
MSAVFQVPEIASTKIPFRARGALHAVQKKECGSEGCTARKIVPRSTLLSLRHTGVRQRALSVPYRARRAIAADHVGDSGRYASGGSDTRRLIAADTRRGVAGGT